MTTARRLRRGGSRSPARTQRRRLPSSTRARASSSAFSAVSSDPDDGAPATLDKPPEDSGYYLSWPASPAVVFNLHYVNAGATAVLREGWVNLWWEPDARVPESWYMGMPPGEPKGLVVAPGGVLDYHASWTVPPGNSIRLVSAFGHRHFWTASFSSCDRAGGLAFA